VRAFPTTFTLLGVFIMITQRSAHRLFDEESLSLVISSLGLETASRIIDAIKLPFEEDNLFPSPRLLSLFFLPPLSTLTK
jgi:hypothetical protein